MCRVLTAASWIMEPFGKIGAYFSLQLSSRNTVSLLKLEMKKVSPIINVKNKGIADNQCEKHKI